VFQPRHQLLAPDPSHGRRAHAILQRQAAANHKCSSIISQILKKDATSRPDCRCDPCTYHPAMNASTSPSVT
jgi:hypothetical protein